MTALHLVQLNDAELAGLRALPDLLQALRGAPAAPAAERLESVREVAGRLRVNVSKVRAAIASGALPATRRPGRGGHLACWIVPSDADRVLAATVAR
ncbi:MAG: hypothetical protein H0X38_02470 [Planctomycetes bacterium]|nr:hypothetical protein [Planctomycetota bacterium]